MSEREDTGIPDGYVDAIASIRQSIADDMRAAREHAGLSVEALALKLSVSVETVTEAESGNVSTSAEYIAALLEACGLPEDWVAPEGADSGRLPRKGQS